MTIDNADQLYEQKGIAFYQAAVQAWITSKMDFDKQLLTLSSAAIGLLATLYTNINTQCLFALWILAGACFIISVILLIFLVLSKNHEYIEAILNNNIPKRDRLNHSMSTAHSIASFAFFFGIVLTFLVAILLAYSNLRD